MVDKLCGQSACSLRLSAFIFYGTCSFRRGKTKNSTITYLVVYNFFPVSGEPFCIFIHLVENDKIFLI